MNGQNFEQLMNMYGGIKVGCGIVAIIFLVAAVVMFFLLKIPAVFSELSGRDAKKAIEEMIAENDSGGLSRSRKIGDDGRRHKKARTGMLGTTKLRKNTGKTANLNTGAGETTVMTGQDPYETMIPDKNEQQGKAKFVIERSIVEVHTNEVI